jgi:phosphoglycerate dehydrogenase-like enzyme
MQIVFPCDIQLSDKAKDELRSLGARFYPDMPIGEAQLIDRIKNAEIIVAKHAAISARVIDRAPQLRYIIAPSVGYQSVDCIHAVTKGVTVLNCPEYNSIAVAEHAIALLLAIKRQLLGSVASLRDGEWQPAAHQGNELYGKRMGIIGYGSIGKHIAQIAQGFGMHIAFVNSGSSAVERETLLRTSDVVCLALPLTPETRNYINVQSVRLLQPHAIIINVGRGVTIDQQELVAALKEGRLAGAGLDVFAAEPSTGKPSDAIVELARLPNVVATPHMAYNTEESEVRLGEVLLKNIRSCLAGKPIHVVAQP